MSVPDRVDHFTPRDIPLPEGGVTRGGYRCLSNVPADKTCPTCEQAPMLYPIAVEVVGGNVGVIWDMTCPDCEQVWCCWTERVEA